jgi:hypothetical protein
MNTMNMKKMVMRTILAAGFAMALLLSTLPTHAATGNIAEQPNDPIAMAFHRTLEDSADTATTEQLSNPIAMATREGAGSCATTEQPNDPIAMAFWRTFEDSGSCTIC